MLFKTLVAMVIMTLSSNVFAESKEKEIKHLLKFVASTQCEYERNGSMHDGKKAAEHIKKKYQYYRDKIKSTDDFIRYSATKSSMSGKPYLIHCEGKKPIESRTWLEMELKRYRAIMASRNFVKRT